MGFLKLFDAVAEKIILDAMENGEFDNIRGKGEPFNYDDDSLIPADLRMGYKILKNSGHLPPEIENEREIRRLKDLLADCDDERERCRQMQKLNYMVLKLNMNRRRPVYLEKSQYYDKIAERVQVMPEKHAEPGSKPVPRAEPQTLQRTEEVPESRDNMDTPPPERKRRFSLRAWFRLQWDKVYA